MKHLSSLCALMAVGFQAAPLLANAEPQFTSRVFFLINESSPQQVVRSRKIIEKEFAQTFAGIPQLQKSRYQMIADGNHVVFTMITAEDQRIPFQNLVSSTVGQMNGVVRTRGRYDLLRTSYDEQAAGPELVVTLDESNLKIKSIVARSVPLRELLGELKLQFGEPRPSYPGSRKMVPGFSYLIPGECATRQVDWSFGTQDESEVKTLDEAMSEVAKLFGLKAENHNGTFIFSGQCPQPAGRQRPTSVELFPTRWMPGSEFHTVPLPVPLRPRAANPVPAIPVGLVE